MILVRVQESRNPSSLKSLGTSGGSPATTCRSFSFVHGWMPGIFNAGRIHVVTQESWTQALQEATEHVLRREELLLRPQQVIPGANFKGELIPFQQEGLAYMLNNRRSLLADEMGLGKTVQTLAFISETRSYPSLLVVPPHLVRNWAKEITRFLVTPALPGENLTLFDEPGEKNIHVVKGLKPYDLPAANLYIIHYLLLRGWKKYLPNFGFKAVFFDEIQELRHRQTEKYSSASLLADSCETVIGLSGTPIYNRGGEMWNVINIIEYHCLGDWDGFSREWCYNGGDTVVDPALLGDYLKREGLLLRRTKDQVLKDLPPKRRVVQTIDFDTGLYGELIQSAIEKAMRYDSIKEFTERGRIKREIENETRQATGIAKAKHVATFVKMLLEAGEKVLLFAYHHAVHDMVIRSGEMCSFSWQYFNNSLRYIAIRLNRFGDWRFAVLSTRWLKKSSGIRQNQSVSRKSPSNSGMRS